jgi:hypothetical protein
MTRTVAFCKRVCRPAVDVPVLEHADTPDHVFRLPSDLKLQCLDEHDLVLSYDAAVCHADVWENRHVRRTLLA